MMSEQKLEQAEWEVVDNVGPQPRPRAAQAAMMQALLGRWWRWKVAGMAVVACVMLALVAALAGVFFVLGLAVVLVSIAVAKIRQALRQHGSSITPR